MLGSDQVRNLTGFIHVANFYHRTAISQRGMDHVFARHGVNQFVDAGRDAIEITGIRANQNRLRQLVMLRLREQIHRDPIRRCATVSQYQNLTRACNHVDAHGTEYPALSRSHIGITRADDFVDLLNRRRAVRQRTNCLCATDREDTINTSNSGRSQHQCVLHAVGCRHHHDDLTHTRYFGWYGVHQYRRGVGRLAAGDIDTNLIERGDFLAKHRAIRLGETESIRAALLLLPLVIDAHPISCLLKCITTLRAQAIECRLQLGTRDF